MEERNIMEENKMKSMKDKILNRDEDMPRGSKNLSNGTEEKKKGEMVSEKNKDQKNEKDPRDYLN